MWHLLSRNTQHTLYKNMKLLSSFYTFIHDRQRNQVFEELISHKLLNNDIIDSCTPCQNQNKPSVCKNRKTFVRSLSNNDIPL